MGRHDEPVLPLAFLSGGKELAALIAAHDWSATPLGPIERWDISLKTSVSIILRSDVPMIILWGSTGVMVYNDAFARFSSTRHPGVLGLNVKEGWPEVAEFNSHVMEVCLGGGTLTYRDQEFQLYRSGGPEKVWINLDYSPILDMSGKPAGVLAIVVETTEKVDAERWQDNERDRQRQMFEQAPGFMAMLVGPQHVFELTNAAYTQLVGHRDALGRPVRQVLPEIEGQGFFELLDQVYQTGQAFVGSSLQAKIQRTPGAPLQDAFIDLIFQPVRNPAGNVIGIFVQGSDVTDRVHAETALKESETRFRTFAESVPVQVWTATPDGRLDWFNSRVYDYSGAKPGVLEGQGWAVIVHPDDVPRAVATWNQAIASGEVYEIEFRLRRHDGPYRWHLARAVTIRDTDGTVLQWIGTNTDIHDQRIATKALAQSERRLQLSQIAGGISSLELDIATGMVFADDSFWQLWGLTPRDSAHISLLEEIVIPEDAHIRSTAMSRTTGTADPNVEYRIKRPDNGAMRWLSRNIDFVYDTNGKPVKMFGVMQDVTQRKEAETRQEMLTHELEHRIKNILAMVGAIASQTLRNTDIETGRKVFNERLRALAKAHELLNDTRWTDASIKKVIENTVSVFPLNQITINGPPIAIGPKMALSLALAVNELGTNAMKYGALSRPTGTVTIDWASHPARDQTGATMVWRWRESGGPPVSKPDRRGFGTFLVESVLSSDFEGSVSLDYVESGVECVLTAPLPGTALPFVTAQGE